MLEQMLVGRSLAILSRAQKFPDEAAGVGECRFDAVGGDRMTEEPRSDFPTGSLNAFDVVTLDHPVAAAKTMHLQIRAVERHRGPLPTP